MLVLRERASPGIRVWSGVIRKDPRGFCKDPQHGCEVNYSKSSEARGMFAFFIHLSYMHKIVW